MRINLDGLPVLTPGQEKDFRLILAVGQLIKGKNLATDSGPIRMAVIQRAQELGVEPNVLLAMIARMIAPGLTALFQPFSDEEVGQQLERASFHGALEQILAMVEKHTPTTPFPTSEEVAQPVIGMVIATGADTLTPVDGETQLVGPHMD